MPCRERLFMQKQFNPALPLTVLYLCLGAARVVDLLFFTDLSTGFVTGGPYLVRYLALLAGVAVGLGLSFRVVRRPAALRGRCAPVGAAMAATGGLLLVTALAGLPAYLVYGKGLWQLLLALLAGVWFLALGARAFAMPLVDEDHPLPSALWTLAPAAYFFALLISRFWLAPAALPRVGYTMRVVSAAAALLFVAALFQVVLAPGGPNGRRAFRCGMWAFLLCTCTETPQAIAEYLAGTADTATLLVGLALGCLGLCGLACAWHATGEEWQEP